MKAKQTRQNWSDSEKKQICEFVNQWADKHGRKPEWREIKRWWESEHPQKVLPCLAGPGALASVMN
jgi:hypothetical protein